MKKIRRGISSIFNRPSILLLGSITLLFVILPIIIIVVVSALATHFPAITCILIAICNAIGWILIGVVSLIVAILVLSIIVAIYHAIKLGVTWLYHKIKG